AALTPPSATFNPQAPAIGHAASTWRTYSAASQPVAADLPHIIAQGVSTSVSTAVAAVAPIARSEAVERAVSPDGAMVESTNGTTVTRGRDGATVTIYPPDAHGLRKMVARASNGATAVSYIDGTDVRLGIADGRRAHA